MQLAAVRNTLLTCRSLKPARDASSCLQRYRKQQMQSQAEELPSSSGPSKADDSGPAEDATSNESKHKASEQDGGLPKHEDNKPDAGTTLTELSTSESTEVGGTSLERTHSMPGKVEGVATAAEASPLLASLDQMVADASSRYDNTQAENQNIQKTRSSPCD